MTHTPSHRVIAWTIVVLSTSSTFAGADVLTPAARERTAEKSSRDIAGQLSRAETLLDTWQIDDAATLITSLAETMPDTAPVELLLGTLRFHQGDYAGATRFYRRAQEGGVRHVLLPLVETSAKATEGFLSFESEHFVVRVAAGRDEVLVEQGLWALERTFVEVQRAFGYRPRHKIVVDIVPNTSALAQMTTLTEEEIQTSGTIAVCKFNRLVITSPDAMVFGYAWLDTLAHEFVHLVVSEVSHNTVPIWLHEGLAKYSESLWRGAPGDSLAVSSSSLLARAIEKNALIPFEAMHPSMAKLPSQEDTALAFAEVFTMVEFLHTLPLHTARVPARLLPVRAMYHVDGFQITNGILAALRKGSTMNEALRSVIGVDLKTLETAWKRSLKTRKFDIPKYVEMEELAFKRAINPKRDSSGSIEVKNANSAGFARIASLLRNRGHVRAAAVEYKKAIAGIDVLPTLLTEQVCETFLEAGEPDEAQRLLIRTLRYHERAHLYVLLGRAEAALGHLREAEDAFLMSLRYNPFVPETHLALLHFAEQRNEEDAAQKIRAQLLLLKGQSATDVTRRTPLPFRDDDARGYLSVQSTPAARVVIDGVDVHVVTPVVDLPVRPGAHVLRLESADGLLGAQLRISIDVDASHREVVTLAPADALLREKWRTEEHEILNASSTRANAPAP